MNDKSLFRKGFRHFIGSIYLGVLFLYFYVIKTEISILIKFLVPQLFL